MNHNESMEREGKVAFPLLSSHNGAAALKRFLERHNYPALTPKAVLFDMDGVLFDSMPNHASSWAKVCTDFGLNMTPEEAYMHEGRTGEATIQILAS